jgi:hypothetical protein
MSEQATDGIEILDPTVCLADAVQPAPRLISLRGKRLGVLDNSKEKTDIFLAALVEQLATRESLADVIQRRKPSYSRVAPPVLIEDLRRDCDGVITAMGA